ncbi:hypothetical protein IID27_03645 [Patescibacteria group bacterium]|nr:hypothetical protein [Patescibacteria group bacterium]
MERRKGMKEMGELSDFERTLESGPCACCCHDAPGTKHMMSCCAYTYQPRAEAEAMALKIRTNREEQPKCPACGSETEVVEYIYCTAIQPRETRLCAACDRKFMVFEDLGHDNLLIWNDENPLEVPFSEFIEEKFEERRRQRMH